MSDDALVMFATSEVDALSGWAMRQRCEPALVLTALRSGGPYTLGSIVQTQLARIHDPVIVEEIARAVVADGPKRVLAGMVIDKACCQLPRDLRMALLRSGTLATTGKYLTTSSGCRAEPGDLTELLADPGTALCAPPRQRLDWVGDEVPTQASDGLIMSEWRDLFPKMADEVLLEVADAFGAAFLRLLYAAPESTEGLKASERATLDGAQGAARALALRLDSRFGADLARREVAMKFLADGWEEGIAELLDTVELFVPNS